MPHFRPSNHCRRRAYRRGHFDFLFAAIADVFNSKVLDPQVSVTGSGYFEFPQWPGGGVAVVTRRRSLGLLAVLLAFAVLLSACTGGSAPPTGPGQHTLSVGASVEPSTLDPTASDLAAIPQVLLYNVYETLLKVDSAGKLQPLLAERWRVSTDGKTYTFTLRPARFASGRPVTPADVQWSIRHVRAGTNKAAADQLAVVSSVKATGTNQVVFRLRRPSNSWLYSMTSTAGMVFDRAAAQNLASRPAGSGPYHLQRWTRGSELVLQRNTSYWAAKAGFAAVTFRYFTDPNAMNSAMLSGGLDIISNLQVPQTLAQFGDTTHYRVTHGTTNGEVVLSLNNSAPALNDVRVRRAVTYAIDRAALKKTVWNDQGTLIGSMVPPTDPWYQDLSGTYPYDPTKARQLLANAGYAKGLTLRLRVPVIPYATASAQFVASQLRDVGITVRTDELEIPRWLDTVFLKADYDMSIIAHVEPRDLARFANPKYYFRYDNQKFQHLVAAADAGTEAQQVTYQRAAAKLLATDAAADWLFLLPNLVVSTAQVQGLAQNATTLSFDLTGVTKTG